MFGNFWTTSVHDMNAERDARQANVRQCSSNFVSSAAIGLYTAAARDSATAFLEQVGGAGRTRLRRARERGRLCSRSHRAESRPPCLGHSAAVLAFVPDRSERRLLKSKRAGPQATVQRQGGAFRCPLCLPPLHRPFFSADVSVCSGSSLFNSNAQGTHNLCKCGA